MWSSVGFFYNEAVNWLVCSIRGSCKKQTKIGADGIRGSRRRRGFFYYEKIYLKTKVIEGKKMLRFMLPLMHNLFHSWLQLKLIVFVVVLESDCKFFKKLNLYERFLKWSEGENMKIENGQTMFKCQKSSRLFSVTVGNFFDEKFCWRQTIFNYFLEHQIFINQYWRFFTTIIIWNLLNERLH